MAVPVCAVLALSIRTRLLTRASFFSHEFILLTPCKPLLLLQGTPELLDLE
jgi:hypothetical protein